MKYQKPEGKQLQEDAQSAQSWLDKMVTLWMTGAGEPVEGLVEEYYNSLPVGTRITLLKREIARLRKEDPEGVGYEGEGTPTPINILKDELGE